MLYLLGEAGEDTPRLLAVLEDLDYCFSPPPPITDPSSRSMEQEEAGASEGEDPHVYFGRDCGAFVHWELLTVLRSVHRQKQVDLYTHRRRQRVIMFLQREDHGLLQTLDALGELRDDVKIDTLVSAARGPKRCLACLEWLTLMGEQFNTLTLLTTRVTTLVTELDNQEISIFNFLSSPTSGSLWNRLGGLSRSDVCALVTNSGAGLLALQHLTQLTQLKLMLRPTTPQPVVPLASSRPSSSSSSSSSSTSSSSTGFPAETSGVPGPPMDSTQLTRLLADAHQSFLCTRRQTFEAIKVYLESELCSLLSEDTLLTRAHFAMLCPLDQPPLGLLYALGNTHPHTLLP